MASTKKSNKPAKQPAPRPNGVSKRTFNKHVSRDKIKWIITGVAILAITVVLCTVAGLTNGFGLGNKPVEEEPAIVAPATQFKVMAEGDEVTSWHIDLKSDVDYEALIKDVKPEFTEKNEGMSVKVYNILNFESVYAEDDSIVYDVAFRAIEVRNGDAVTYFLHVNMGGDEFDLNRALEKAIHCSDIGWSTPSGDYASLLYNVYMSQWFEEYPTTIKSIENAEVIANIMGIERA